MTTKCAIILLYFVALNASICCNAIKRKQDPVPVDANFILKSGHRLNTGESLQNNNYVLTMQQDCNLVLYDSGNLIWATNTTGLSNDCYLYLERDGNLFVCTLYDTAIWTNNPIGSPVPVASQDYVLILQKDRNLVIYGPAIWASATNV